MMVMSAAAFAGDRLRKILQVRELAGLGRGSKIARQLVELAGGTRIALRLRGRSRTLQVGGDLFRHRRVFGRVRLLKLLERAGQLAE